MSSSPAESKQPRLLGIFAHPDDETFCAGGTLAKYVAAGAEAMVVSATRGQAGQIWDARAATRRTLGQVREQELRQACHQLGVQHALCLDYMDGTLQDVDRSTLVGDLVHSVRTFRPDVVITFGPDGAYGHPDHIAISQAATEACARAGNAEHFPEQITAGRLPHTPARLYYSHFPRSRLLLLDRLAHWLVELHTRFQGTADFVRALSIFAEESAQMGYISDYLAVHWFPAGIYIVEQGEPGTSLYLILTGQAEVVHEEVDGTLHPLGRLGPGEFFGELALAQHQMRTAHVIAIESVTCLVFASGRPTAFAGRGAGARLTADAASDPAGEAQHTGATTCIDVSAYVDRKIAALAAHHTQCPIEPGMFPLAMLREMLGREYFVRMHPPIELEPELSPRP